MYVIVALMRHNYKKTIFKLTVVSSVEEFMAWVGRCDFLAKELVWTLD